MISELIKVENIIIGKNFSSKDKIIEFVSIYVEQKYDISKKIILKGLINREKKGSTAIGKGIAIPHCKIKNVKTPIIIFIVCNESISFVSPDNSKVDIFFFLLMPLDNNQKHLEILALLSEFICSEEIRNELRKSKTSHHVLNLIKKWENNVIN